MAKTDSDRHRLWRSFTYLHPYRTMVIGIYAAMVVINGVVLIVPQLIRLGIDRGIYGGDLSQLTRATMLLLGLTLCKGLAVFYQGQWTEIVSQNVAYDIRNALLHKLSTLPFAFHDRTEAGQILSRAMQDVERLRFLTGRAILRLVEGTLLILSTAAILLWMHTTLALLIMTTLPFLLHRAYQFGRRFRPLSLQIQNQLGVLTAQLEQNLRGAPIVKGFAQETAETERFLATNETWFDLSTTSIRIQAVNAPMLDMIANLGTVCILWYGGWLVIQGQLTLGAMVAFTTYLVALIRPIRFIGRIIPMLALAASAGERLFAILDAPADLTDSPTAQPLPRLRGQVCFDHVSFAYNNSHDILHDVSFTVQPGQVVAVIGATGAGKSTLINLIARFYEPTRGRISLDGYDIRQATMHSLRSQIGFVMQDTMLFAATIRDNITFGRPGASEADIIQAAREAQAHDFIMAMPKGYDTYVGERGVTLSGGQKQRLAIARALLTEPRLLILDDATSSVDNHTDRLIQTALEQLMIGRTTFVIAHRFNTVRRADLILLLDKGHLVGCGTHTALLATLPLYHRMFALQAQPSAVEIQPQSPEIKEY